MSFGKLGALGRGFGRLGSAPGGTGTPPVLGPTPVMRFNAAANSQLLAVLEDF